MHVAFKCVPMVAFRGRNPSERNRHMNARTIQTSLKVAGLIGAIGISTANAFAQACNGFCSPPSMWPAQRTSVPATCPNGACPVNSRPQSQSGIEPRTTTWFPTRDPLSSIRSGVGRVLGAQPIYQSPVRQSPSVKLNPHRESPFYDDQPAAPVHSPGVLSTRRESITNSPYYP